MHQVFLIRHHMWHGHIARMHHSRTCFISTFRGCSMSRSALGFITKALAQMGGRDRGFKGKHNCGPPRSHWDSWHMMWWLPSGREDPNLRFLGQDPIFWKGQTVHFLEWAQSRFKLGSKSMHLDFDLACLQRSLVPGYRRQQDSLQISQI